MRALALSLLLIACAPAWSQVDRFVSDELTITMRTGKGNEFQILATLASGTRVRVLEAGEDGYSLVRLDSGLEGWVISRYLSAEPSARDQVGALQTRLRETERENLRLSGEVEALAEEWGTFQEALAQATATIAELQASNERLRSQAGRPEALEVEVDGLREHAADLRHQNELLRERSAALEDRARLHWFLAGGGVLGLGLLMGFVAGRARRSSRPSWGRL